MPDVLISSMTIEELEEAMAQCRAVVDQTKAKLRELVAVYDQKVAQRDMAAKVASMTDAERAALAQIIQPTSIKSEEGFSG